MNLTLEQLQHFASSQNEAENIHNAIGDGITDMAQRVVGQPLASAQELDSTMDGIRASLAGPAVETAANIEKRMNKARLKLAQQPHTEAMEMQTALTGMLARLQSAGFSGNGRSQSVSGQHTAATQVVPGKQGQASGTAAASTGAKGMALPGTSQDIATGGNGQGMASTGSAGISNLAGGLHGLPRIPPRNPPPSPPSPPVSLYGLPPIPPPAVPITPTGGAAVPTAQACPPGYEWGITGYDSDTGAPTYGCVVSMSLTGGPPPSPPPALPPPPSPPPALPPPPKAPDTSTCNLCEAIVYAAQLLCHCVSSLANPAQPAAQPEPRIAWQAPPLPPTDVEAIEAPKPSFDDEMAELESAMASQFDKPPPANGTEIRPNPRILGEFGAEPGGAIGGQTTSLQSPSVGQ